MRLLIVEDDAALAQFLKQSLEAEHYAVDIAGDGEQARTVAQENSYDFVLLDLNLPRIDGIAVLRHLRTRNPSLPILVLTGRSRLEERVQCLDLGADDFLAKPFSYSELSARIRALLRRSHVPAESVLTIEDLKLDRIERRVERAGRRIELTGKEFALLEYLMKNAGRRITRAMIIEHVWNLSFDTTTNVVDVYVNYATAEVDKKKMSHFASAMKAAFRQSKEAPAAGAVDASSIPLIPNQEQVKADGFPQELSQLSDAVVRAFEGDAAAGRVSLRQQENSFVISLREKGLFDSGSAKLKPSAFRLLDRLVPMLNRPQYTVRVEGFTDDEPIHTPEFPSNWELSTSRATAVVQIFIKRYGVDPENLSAGGYAGYHPVADNSSEAGRSANRRVDLVVLVRHP